MLREQRTASIVESQLKNSINNIDVYKTKLKNSIYLLLFYTTHISLIYKCTLLVTYNSQSTNHSKVNQNFKNNETTRHLRSQSDLHLECPVALGCIEKPAPTRKTSSERRSGSLTVCSSGGSRHRQRHRDRDTQQYQPCGRVVARGIVAVRWWPLDAGGTRSTMDGSISRIISRSSSIPMFTRTDCDCCCCCCGGGGC